MNNHLHPNPPSASLLSLIHDNRSLLFPSRSARSPFEPVPRRATDTLTSTLTRTLTHTQKGPSLSSETHPEEDTNNIAAATAAANNNNNTNNTIMCSTFIAENRLRKRVLASQQPSSSLPSSLSFAAVDEADSPFLCFPSSVPSPAPFAFSSSSRSFPSAQGSLLDTHRGPVSRPLFPASSSLLSSSLENDDQKSPPAKRARRLTMDEDCERESETYTDMHTDRERDREEWARVVSFSRPSTPVREEPYQPDPATLRTPQCMQCSETTTESEDEGHAHAQAQRQRQKQRESLQHARPQFQDLTPFMRPARLFGNRKTRPSYERDNDELDKHTRGASLEESRVLLTVDAQRFPLYSELCLYRDFSVRASLGHGAFSEVFKVEDKHNLGQFFAVKKLSRKLRSVGERERLLREAEAMKLLTTTTRTCAHVPRFVAAWQENEHLNMLMEASERGTVRDLIAKHSAQGDAVPTCTIWHILHDIASALKHIHSFHLVHLDVKPANILIGEDAVIKLTDFGLATREGSTNDDQEGDPRYMAKELLNDSLRTSSADIFSLGITIFELASVNMLDKENNRGFNFHSASSFLPANGPGWHKLRAGDDLRVPHRPYSLNMLISQMMHPKPAVRPTASEILSLPDIAGLECEPELTGVFSQYAPTGVEPMEANRPASFDLL